MSATQTAPAVLLSYQQELLASTTDPVVIYEKSRRIGISWAAACEAVTVSAKSRADGGMDTLYIGYNLDMAREFVDDAAFWAKHLHGFAAEAEEFVFNDRGDGKDGGQDIQAFRITFASDFQIIALSSRPRSLRGRQGFVIIDEAAFHDDLAGLVKAAMALLMWGGKVWFISTHDGDDNPFNDLVQEVRAGRRPYKLFRTTLDDAVQDGLFKRICLVTGKEWSPEAEAAWVSEIRDFYGDDASEELDVIPSQGSGVFLTRAMIDRCMNPHYPVLSLKCENGFEQRPDHERHAYAAAWLDDTVDPYLEQLDKKALSFFGGDFGRSGDLSVFWPGQLDVRSLSLRVPFSVELRNVPFREQEQILHHIVDRLPRFVSGAVDARGIGAQIAEQAAQKYGFDRIEQVKATREWYRENMPGYKARFEDQTIEIPRDPDTRQDLRLIKLDKGVAMVPDNKRIRSSRGGWRHGDAAVAGALLHFASQMDVVPIEFQSTGETRAGYGAFDNSGLDSKRPTTDRGWGTIAGSTDFRGY